MSFQKGRQSAFLFPVSRQEIPATITGYRRETFQTLSMKPSAGSHVSPGSVSQAHKNLKSGVTCFSQLFYLSIKPRSSSSSSSNETFWLNSHHALWFKLKFNYWLEVKNMCCLIWLVGHDEVRVQTVNQSAAAVSSRDKEHQTLMFNVKWMFWCRLR